MNHIYTNTLVHLPLERSASLSPCLEVATIIDAEKHVELLGDDGCHPLAQSKKADVSIAKRIACEKLAGLTQCMEQGCQTSA